MVTASPKIWTKEEILHLIKTNEMMVGKSLLKLYGKQTPDEQAAHSTRYQNKVGFNGVDANFLSSLAEFYDKYGRLSEKQLVYARKKLRKYAVQLVKMANNSPMKVG